MEKSLSQQLSDSAIFKNMELEKIDQILKRMSYTIANYDDNEIIAYENSTCKSIGVVLDGIVNVTRLFSTGESLFMDSLGPGSIFGEVIIFSGTLFYPATIQCALKCKVMFIEKEDFLSLCTTNDKVLSNFMSILSNKILMLNKKLKDLSFKTLREKISSYIFDQYMKAQNLTIDVLTREDMAVELNIPRPSLSREMAIMKKEGIIDYDRHSIKILNLGLLEAGLFHLEKHAGLD